MKRCQKCDAENRDSARFCQECGAKFTAEKAVIPDPVAAIVRSVSSSGFKSGSVTSVGIPPLVESNGAREEEVPKSVEPVPGAVHSVLSIERGEAANTEFPLTNEESQIGRWDADNGIFPDVDLDTFDLDAKVSRRHARVIFRDGIFMIEDLGSTNGTFVNRGRRMLPGSPQILNDGDEIIVGKTFLRFRIKS